MKPKLVIFRSNRYIYAQIIDGGKTIASVNKMTDPVAAGSEIGKLGIKHKVKEVVFDRNGNRYHGNIKKFADAAREAGLVF